MSATTLPRSNGNGTKFFIAGLALLALFWFLMTAQVTPTVQTNSGLPKVFVVADDEPDNAAKTIGAVSAILEALGLTPVALTATSTDALLNLALHGNNGGPVDFVMLDGSYAVGDRRIWSLPGGRRAKGPELASLLRSNGYRGPIFLTSLNPSDSIGMPGSELFADMFGKLELWKYPLKLVDAFKFLMK
ncbi:hypothetical protein HY086_04230 [Candidatus Gottesmanbacteria bacterium]|nr:hypothetical protein [Candidatus Gottesmanbacteria bacterium]